MKCSNFTPLALVLLIASLFVLPANRAQADTNYISRFDSPSEADAWYFDFGGVGHTNGFDATMDGLTNPASGSLKITMAFDTNLIASGDNKGAYSIALPVPISSNDVLNLDSVHMDLKVDSGSATDKFGLNGYLALVFRTGDTWFWAVQWSDNIGANYQVDSNGWRHIDQPITLNNTDPIHHITLQLWGNDAQDIPGPVTFWIDNVYYTTLTTTTSGPPAMTLIHAVPGCDINASVLASTYQRQDIRTADSRGNFTWINPSNGPCTYTFTLTNYPSGPTNGYEAHMMLVGNHFAPGAFADYNETNVIYLRVFSVLDTNTQTVHYDEELYYKVNAPNSTIFANFLGRLSGPTVLGTYGLTLAGTNVTMFGPSGTLSTNMDPAVLSAFNVYTYPYLGIIPNDDANIGQSATFSGFVSSGATVAFTEHFNNLNQWKKNGIAQDASGVLIQPSNTFAKILWPPPASPTYSVHATNKLVTGVASWPATSYTINPVGTNKVVLIPTPTNNASYFRLETP